MQESHQTIKKGRFVFANGDEYEGIVLNFVISSLNVQKSG
jgi:hypothetical protein